MKTRLLKQILIIPFIILLSACISTIPKEIREAPLKNTPAAEVRTYVDGFIGQTGIFIYAILTIIIGIIIIPIGSSTQ